MNLIYKKFETEEAPMALLLDADPDEKRILSYLPTGFNYVAMLQGLEYE